MRYSILDYLSYSTSSSGGCLQGSSILDPSVWILQLISMSFGTTVSNWSWTRSTTSGLIIYTWSSSSWWWLLYFNAIHIHSSVGLCHVVPLQRSSRKCTDQHIAVYLVQKEPSYSHPIVDDSNDCSLFAMGLCLDHCYYQPQVFSVILSIYPNRVPIADLIGIFCGHVYYYFADVLPKIAKLRGWKKQEFVKAPKLLYVKIGRCL